LFVAGEPYSHQWLSADAHQKQVIDRKVKDAAQPFGPGTGGQEKGQYET